jgi:plastocyanin
MRRLLRTIAVLAGVLMISQVPARSQPPAGARAHYATQADVDRLEKEVADQKALLERLIALQQQYAASLAALLPDSGAQTHVAATPPAITVTPAAVTTPEKQEPPPAMDAKLVPKPAAAKPTVAAPAKGVGTILGRVKGGSGDTYVYVDDIPAVAAHASATMKQQDKQFAPRVLVVQKGTQVQFPNMDAVFHNVFSVTPDNSFDLGSYRQGESKSVRLVKPGVVSVYCNMHPQMVGYILVVPSSYYVHAGADGFYRLVGVPAGHHRVVAWTPNAKPAVSEVDVTDGEPATVELQLHAARETPHTNKDGLPYGSYKD